MCFADVLFLKLDDIHEKNDNKETIIVLLIIKYFFNKI